MNCYHIHAPVTSESQLLTTILFFARLCQENISTPAALEGSPVLQPKSYREECAVFPRTQLPFFSALSPAPFPRADRPAFHQVHGTSAEAPRATCSGRNGPGAPVMGRSHRRNTKLSYRKRKEKGRATFALPFSILLPFYFYGHMRPCRRPAFDCQGHYDRPAVGLRLTTPQLRAFPACQECWASPSQQNKSNVDTRNILRRMPGRMKITSRSFCDCALND